MIIRKLFPNINSGHIVRNCSSKRCAFSQHQHSTTVELFLESNGLDNAYMVLDFGLFKPYLTPMIKSFHNSYMLWDKDDKEYVKYVHDNYDRIITMPFNPSAEALAAMFFYMADQIIKNTQFNNGEKPLELSMVRYHETVTGYAEATRKDLELLNLSKITDIQFSDEIKKSWLFDWQTNIINNKQFVNPVIKQQVLQ